MTSAVLAGSPARTTPVERRESSTRRVPDPEVQGDAADLERQADELLGRYLIPGVDSGVYTQIQLDRKARDERKRLSAAPDCGATDEMIDYLVERQIEDLIDVANLSAIQEIAYRLYVSGLNSRQISVALGIKGRTIEERLRVVKRKVKAAYKEGRYAGWYEVYLSEVNRLAYRGSD